MPSISIIDVAAHTDTLRDMAVCLPGVGWTIWGLLRGYYWWSGADM